MMMPGNETLNTAFGFVERVHVEGKGHYLNAEDVARVLAALGDKLGTIGNVIAEDAEELESILADMKQEEEDAKAEKEETEGKTADEQESSLMTLAKQAVNSCRELNLAAEEAFEELQALSTHLDRSETPKFVLPRKRFVVKRVRRRRCKQV